MSELVPMFTTTLGVKPEIATKILFGLASGKYERIGGIIRYVDSKVVVAWLRDMSGTQPVNLLSRLSPLLQLNAATSVLNLSISTIGFVMVMRRLNVIENDLATISKSLAEINRKLDLSFYANFHAALELARTAFDMRDDVNRRTSANQAIYRFLEAEHHYLSMLDAELQIGGPAVSPLLSTLFLAYVSAARCYLELGESETAWGHLQKGDVTLSSRVQQYYSSIIGINPAIFLHPDLADSISLERLTRLFRHYDVSLSAGSAFESLRKAIWTTASENPESWLRELPTFLWNQDTDRWEKKNLRRQPRSRDEMFKRVLPRLPEVFTQVEIAHESLGCVQGYAVELRYLLDHNISFPAWQQIKLPVTEQDDPIALLLPENSELLAS